MYGIDKISPKPITRIIGYVKFPDSDREIPVIETVGWTIPQPRGAHMAFLSMLANKTEPLEEVRPMGRIDKRLEKYLVSERGTFSPLD